MRAHYWPELIINLKQIVTGERISKYVVTAAELARRYRHPLIVCVNNTEVHEAVDSLEREDPALFDYFHIFGQSIDPVAPGASWTGSTTPWALAHLGAHGTLINHYEDRIYGHSPGKRQKHTGEVRDKPEDFNFLRETIIAGLDANLNLVICADGPQTAAEIAQLVSGEDFKEQIYRNFIQRLLDLLLNRSYVEFERIFGRFPEGLSKGSFRQRDFPDIFFGLLTKEESQNSYQQFKEPFNLYREMLGEVLEEILGGRLKDRFYPQVMARLYKTIAIAVEWDEFIGKGISIVQEKPEVIRETVAAVKGINPAISVYCGAGVETAQDIITAIRDCGAVGSLAASAFATPFREKVQQGPQIDWEASVSWQEAVERYLREISEYHYIQRPFEETPLKNQIFLIQEDTYGLKLLPNEKAWKGLLSLLEQPIYRDLPLQVKTKDMTYRPLTVELAKELRSQKGSELQIYGRGIRVLSFMERLLGDVSS